MANVRVTHHDGSVETFEDARLEIDKGGVLKVRERGEPTRWYSPTGWRSAVKVKKPES